MIDLLLNIKGLNFRLLDGADKSKVSLSVKGSKKVTGADFDLSENIEIVNKDHQIASVNDVFIWPGNRKIGLYRRALPVLKATYGYITSDSTGRTFPKAEKAWKAVGAKAIDPNTPLPKKTNKAKWILH